MNRRTERMNRAIGAYFAACDATRERIPLKNGGFEERQIPYTLYGLAVATGVAPRRILELAGGVGSKARVWREAVSRIAAYTLERALLGELTYQAALAALAVLDPNDGKQDAAAVTVTMDASAAEWAE